MHKTTIQVLMIDDDEEDAMIVKRLLGGPLSTRYQVDWVTTYEAGMARLSERRHDICLLDYHLGAHTGLELLGEARRRQYLIPVIILTGLGTAEVDQAALEAGALDYLPKDELTASILERSIRYSLQQAQTLKSLQQAQAELESKVEARTAELQAANDQLAQADRQKDEFLAMLAHELRNPLAPIRNAAQILATLCNSTCAANQQTARQRDIIERQVAHMARLLDDLLDVSRITRGKIQLRREKLDLRGVAERAVDSMRSLIESRKQEIACQMTSAPLPIEGDPTRLEQVLRNLLHNATKYTEPGGCIWMTVGLELDGQQAWQAVARVRDSGVGIAPPLLDRIFDLFVQAEQSLARTQGGLGIGLSMVKRLVELHGGSVTAHSQGLGLGSEFVIRLPMSPLIEEKAVAGKPPEAHGAGGETKSLRRVLIVEDNEDAATSLSDLLEIWGHQVRTAYDGHQALREAKDWEPEVILLDIGLPGMDGYEVAHHLREEEETAKIRLIALTGYGAEEDRRRTQEAGFDDHLIKPVELNHLQALLREA